MTVKGLLHRKIDEMSEDEAELLLEWLEPVSDGELPQLSPEDLRRLDRALEQERLGQVASHAEVLRRFGRA